MPESLNIFTFLNYRQYEPRRARAAVQITRLLNGALTLDLSCSVDSAPVIPETPLGLAVRSENQERDTRFQKNVDRLHSVKDLCDASSVPFKGRVSNIRGHDLERQVPEDTDLIMMCRSTEQPSLVSRMLGDPYRRMVQAAQSPVWLLKPMARAFRSVICLDPDYASLPRYGSWLKELGKTAGNTIELSEPDLDSAISFLADECRKYQTYTEKACIDPPALLIFSVSCLKGFPRAHPFTKYLRALAVSSPHHMLILPD